MGFFTVNTGGKEIGHAPITANVNLRLPIPQAVGLVATVAGRRPNPTDGCARPTDERALFASTPRDAKSVTNHFMLR